MAKTPKPKPNDPTTKSKLDIRRVPPGDIIIGEGLRQIDEKVVAEVAKSIEKVGLLNPPTVYEPRGGELKLVAGQIRVAAAKLLGLDFIDVIVVKRNKEQNRRRTLTENLARQELTKLERGQWLKEWMESNKVKGGKNSQPHDKAITAAAKATGMDRTTIRNSIKLANITPTAQAALKEAGLDDNEKVMQEVAKSPPMVQRAKVNEIVLRREKESKARQSANQQGKAGAANDNTQNAKWNALLKAWNSSSAFKKAWADAKKADRYRFIDTVLKAKDWDQNKAA